MKTLAYTVLFASILASNVQGQGMTATFRLNLADARFTASNGCVSAQVLIDGSVYITRWRPYPGTDFGADILINKVDGCRNEYGGGSGETGRIDFRGDLQQARLVGDIPLNLSGGGTVHVDLTWIGIGRVTQETLDLSSGLRALIRETLWSRKAILSGTIDGLPVTSTESATLIQRSVHEEVPPGQ